jgi:hypothetical protein
MYKRGLLLALFATVLSGCVIHPAHLRFTPPRVDVVVDGHSGHGGGYYNGYNNGGYYNGGHRHHHGGH